MALPRPCVIEVADEVPAAKLLQVVGGLLGVPMLILLPWLNEPPVEFTPAASDVPKMWVNLRVTFLGNCLPLLGDLRRCAARSLTLVEPRGVLS